MIRFFAGKTEIMIDIGFLAVTALVSLNGTYSIWAFAACLIHEAGHIIMAAILDYRTVGIICSITGVSIRSVPEKLHSFKEDLLVVYGGIMANAAAGTACLFTGNNIFGAVNIILAAVNALPFSVLDGGTAAEIISEKYSESILYSVLRVTASMSAVILSVTAVCFFSSFFAENISAFIFLAYITVNEIMILTDRIKGR